MTYELLQNESSIFPQNVSNKNFMSENTRTIYSHMSFARMHYVTDNVYNLSCRMKQDKKRTSTILLLT